MWSPRCRTPTDPWTARIAAAYEVIGSKLTSEGFTRRRLAAGDIFRRRQYVLRIQLTRKLGTTAWRLREVGTMRQIEWHEPREAGRALAGGDLAQLFGACADDATPKGTRDAAMLSVLF